MPLATLVDLVNGWGSRPRLEAGEQGDPYPPTSDVSGRMGFLEPAIRGDERTLVDVADRLHPVCAAADADERRALVNELLTSVAVRPCLRPDGDAFRESWLVEDSRDAVLAAAALALRDHLAHASGHRMGICGGADCADVYVDGSPTGRRRFCSLTCQNRTRAATFRRRHRSESG